MNQIQTEAQAFAELSRKLALSIIQALSVGETQEADSIAHSLLWQSIARKRELVFAVETENPDRYDLTELAIDPNAPNDEADGSTYD